MASPHPLPPRATLTLERALDIISVYFDGVFIGTQWGHGEPLTFTLPQAVTPGEHTLDIRAEIWGHANFHDTGHYATRLDAKRGVIGAVMLNGEKVQVSTGKVQVSREDAAPPPRHLNLETSLLSLETFSLPAGQQCLLSRPLDRDYPLGAVLTLEAEKLHGEIWLGDWMVGRYILGVLKPREDGGKIFLTAGPPNQFFLPGALARKGAELRLTARASHPGAAFTRATLEEII